MAILNILSAGAAQAVVSRISRQFQRQHGGLVEADYSAVGTLKARVLAGEPVDVIILTAALIDELVLRGVVVPGTRVDLGKVGTTVAVRANTPRPEVQSTPALRSNLLAASRIICPDPAVATAGKVFLAALGELRILEQVRSRLEYTPSGTIAMERLAQGTGALELGVAQITEVTANEGVAMAGPLPPELQSVATYSAGLVVGADHVACAREFIEGLAGSNARAMLSAAGFDIGPELVPAVTDVA